MYVATCPLVLAETDLSSPNDEEHPYYNHEIVKSDHWRGHFVLRCKNPTSHTRSLSLSNATYTGGNSQH